MRLKTVLQYKQIIFVFFLFVFLFFGINIAISRASNIKSAKDMLSNSNPNATTTHEIYFTPTNDIPAMGKISIIPEKEKFLIPNSFNFSNIKFFVATSTEIVTSTKYVTEYTTMTSTTTVGTSTVVTTSTKAITHSVVGTTTKYIFFERQLSNVSTSTYDFVNINYGLSGKVDIILNSGQAINANSRVKIELGDDVVGIVNPSDEKSYGIGVYTYDADSGLIGKTMLRVAMAKSVKVSTGIPRIRSNGIPTGTLVGGTTQTIMSLITNFGASCRYSTASGTPYSLMENSFNTSDTFFHSILLDGLSSGAFYTYYVKCNDIHENYTDDTDFIISFNIETTGDGGTGGGEGGGTGSGSGSSNSGHNDGSGPGSGGGEGGGNGGGVGENTSGDNGNQTTGNTTSNGGGGGGGGGSAGGGIGLSQPVIPKLPDPDLFISGLSYSNSEVVVLQDGVEIKRMRADINGVFNMAFNDLKKGVYTYHIYSNDPENIKSKGHSATFWMENGTKTRLNDIILPPTIEIASSSGMFIVSGYSVPKSQIELWYYPENTVGKIIKKWVHIDKKFKWKLEIDKADLEYSNYEVKARSNLLKGGYSEFSNTKKFSVNQENGECKLSGADLNNDSKVNLVDFSILMYHWGTSHVEADVNCDGNVNLVDFSILMYNWTG